MGNFRDLCRALSVEGKVAAAAGQTGNAVQSYLDIIRLAQDTSRGGLELDDVVASGIEGVGLQGIVEELSKLDAANLEVLRRALQTLTDSREPLEVILERDRTFNRLALGWQGRLYFWLDDTLAASDKTNQAVSDIRARGVARLRLLIAEAAVRRHVLMEGSPPESLASLVPKYLAAVPNDPYRDGPLVYRRTAEGYLLYSVGGNGTDDGGQRVSFLEATSERKGDLFFDASEEVPELSDGAEESPDNAND